MQHSEKLGKEDFYRLAAASFSGNITAQEQRTLDDWKAASPENLRTWEDARLVWVQAPAGSIWEPTEGETASAWNRLHERLTDESSNVIRWWPAVYRIAAAVALVAVAYYFLRPEPGGTRLARQETVVRSSGDAAETFTLSEGTRVVLSAKSEVSIGPDFGTQRRDVSLRGSAVFDVAKDPSRPFSITNDNAVITVLGTSFAVTRDRVITVEVTEGRVMFASVYAANEGILLRAGEGAYLEPGVDARPVRLSAREEENEEGTTAPDASTRASTAKETIPAEKSKSTDTQPAKAPQPAVADSAVAITAPSVPASPLSVKHEWNKNDFKQTVVEGTITNHTTDQSYKNIVLGIRYVKGNGKTATTQVTVFETVRPGDEIPYRTTLMDMFVGTQEVEVTILKSEVAKE